MPRRAALLALALLALLPAPASAADLCDRYAGKVEVFVVTRQQGPERHTRLLLCNERRGVAPRRVVTRAVLRRGRGRAIVDADARGRHLVWVEVVRRGPRSTAYLVEADSRTGRRRRRTAFDRGLITDRLYVSVNAAGSILTFSGGRIEVRTRPRPAPRTVARGRLAEELFESGVFGDFWIEDGRTIGWFPHSVDEPDIRFHDFGDFGAGCPRRRLWSTSFENAEVVATEARYGDPDAEFNDPSAELTYLVVRACLRATGEDPVVATGSSGDETTYTAEVVAAQHGWVAVWSELNEGVAVGGCPVARLHSVDLLHGRTGRAGGSFARCGDQPGIAVVTARGVPARLIGRSPGPPELVAVTEEGVGERLDSGDITNVRADGEDIVWTNAGEERRARP